MTRSVPLHLALARRGSTSPILSSSTAPALISSPSWYSLLQFCCACSEMLIRLQLGIAATHLASLPLLYSCSAAVKFGLDECECTSRVSFVATSTGEQRRTAHEACASLLLAAHERRRLHPRQVSLAQVSSHPLILLVCSVFWVADISRYMF